MYIHGPFNFTPVHGHKTRDCVSQSDWDALAKQTSIFHHHLPWFNHPSYSIHVDRGVQIIINNAVALAASSFSTMRDCIPFLTKGIDIFTLSHPPPFISWVAKIDLIQRGEICALEFHLQSPHAECDSCQLLFARLRKLGSPLSPAAMWSLYWKLFSHQLKSLIQKLNTLDPILSQSIPLSTLISVHCLLKIR